MAPGGDVHAELPAGETPRDSAGVDPLTLPNRPAGPRLAAGASAEHSPAWRDVTLLTLLFGVLFFFGLGQVALVNPDEGRYAEIPREMVATGDYVTPRLDGVFYFEKPPLMYWMVAGFLKAFGPSELSVRAVPALFALGGVLCAYGAARRLHGRTAGLAAAIVLGSSLLYFGLGRILILDTTVSVLMSAALFCFILGVNEPPGKTRRWLFYGLYASAALATLTKGLIGFLIPGAVMFFWLLIFNQWRRLRPLYLPSGVALFLAIAAPWHVLVAQRNEIWAHFYFVREHWERFTTTEHGRDAPWWYFIPFIVAGLFPWTGCLRPALREALRGGWKARGERATAWFFVTWALFVFLFFSQSHSKLAPYILPVFPPLAVLIGQWLAEGWRTQAARFAEAIGVFAAMAGVLGVAFVALLARPELFGVADIARFRSDVTVSAACLLAGAVLAPWWLRRGQMRWAAWAVAVSVGGLYLALGEAHHKIARTETKAFALLVNERAAAGDRIYHYHDFFHDFTFYTERLVGTVAAHNTELEVRIDPAAQASGRFIEEEEFRRQWTGSQRIWVVARRREVEGKLFADPSFHYHLLAVTKRHCLFSNQP
jgi:4-amino-4-deoxy-L-arabinose transferase-like glycosyltransferase